MPVIPSAPAPAVGLISIGPVVVNHGDPKFSWDSNATGHGIMPASVSGSCLWHQAKTLLELVNNPAAQATVGGRTGVTEWIEYGGPLLSDLTGYYLLGAFTLAPSQEHSLAGPDGDVDFALDCFYLGDVA